MRSHGQLLWRRVADGLMWLCVLFVAMVAVSIALRIALGNEGTVMRKPPVPEVGPAPTVTRTVYPPGPAIHS